MPWFVDNSKTFLLCCDPLRLPPRSLLYLVLVIRIPPEATPVTLVEHRRPLIRAPDLPRLIPHLRAPALRTRLPDRRPGVHVGVLERLRRHGGALGAQGAGEGGRLGARGAGFGGCV